jgi:hypothetical protein
MMTTKEIKSAFGKLSQSSPKKNNKREEKIV